METTLFEQKGVKRDIGTELNRQQAKFDLKQRAPYTTDSKEINIFLSEDDNIYNVRTTQTEQ